MLTAFSAWAERSQSVRARRPNRLLRPTAGRGLPTLPRWALRDGRVPTWNGRQVGRAVPCAPRDRAYTLHRRQGLRVANE
jgi:hypothetical protein